MSNVYNLWKNKTHTLTQIDYIYVITMLLISAFVATLPSISCNPEISNFLEFLSDWDRTCKDGFFS